MTRNKSQRAWKWAALCHLTSLMGIPLVFLIVRGIPAIPVAHLLAPLLVWQLKKKKYPFVDDQGKECLNFQLSLTLYGISAFLVLMSVLLISVIITYLFLNTDQPLLITWLNLGLIVLISLVPPIIVVQLLMVIIATIKANKGEFYRYPFTIRFLK